MDKIKHFLKTHSIIPNEFIDEFVGINSDQLTGQTDFAIDLDVIAKWLNVRKDNLFQTLKATYKKDIDYIIVNAKKPNPSKYGGNNYKKILLTPDCFKRLCMLSKSKKAEDVRSYYIELESLLFRYYNQALAGMELEIKNMENKLRPKSAKEIKEMEAGYVYVMKASDKFDSMKKIGSTKNLKHRLETYQSGKFEDTDIIYKYRTDDLRGVEDCVKNALKDVRVRKYKEIYKADINVIKKIIGKCQDIQNIKHNYTKRKPSLMTGGYYIGLFKD
jgi:phage anti-repressor protein/predicted GIY-YIG superfamily endonuclease